MEHTSEQGRRFLVAMDGSPNCYNALQWFLKNVHRVEDFVILANVGEFHVGVHPPFLSTKAVVYQPVIQTQVTEIREYYENLEQLIKDKNINGTAISLHGDPGEMLVRASKEHNVDAIVSGCRGLGTIRRTILGGVSDYLIKHSDVPVIVCKYKKPIE